MMGAFIGRSSHDDMSVWVNGIAAVARVVVHYWMG